MAVWKLEIPPDAVLEVVKWHKDLELPPRPTLEWAAEQYFRGPIPGLDLTNVDTDLPVQWYSRQS
jgi:hypothetical protein